MNKLEKETLVRMRDQLGGYTWQDTELEELVNPRLGIITGFQELLEQLEDLRRIDLEAIPPASSIKQA